ncbi:MAG: DNA primase [candidate division Zixibacteria bacterium]
MIPRETIDRIRDASDIVDLIGQYIPLKKRGRNFLAKCPFHTEKTPSFNVSAEKQMYYCFGCGVGGNVFTFLLEHEKMTFVEAARFLAAKANIPIKEAKSDFKREQLERINYAHQVAVDYYSAMLQNRKYKKVRVDYLTDKRGITKESIERFSLGLAGESWDGLITHAAKKDISAEDLSKAGLASFSENSKKFFDRFRQRLMIPIYSLSGKPIAFGGRTLRKGEPAKYVNSPETQLYSKSSILYGLNIARDHIRDEGFVYVVEGYFDVISLWQCGIGNVVASSGTAFSQQQARLLARFTEKVYLFFDADSAGHKAAIRSVDSLYDAGLDVRVIVPPAGEDPDSIARSGGKEPIEALQKAAIEYIPYRMRDVDLGTSSLIAREKLVKELAAVANRIGDNTRRSLFIEDASTALGVDRLLLQQPIPAQRAEQSSSIKPAEKFNKIEMQYLSLLFANPGHIDYALENVSVEDLDSKHLSRLYAAMITQYRMDGELDAQRLVETLADDSLVSVLGEVSMIEWEPENISKDIRDFTTGIVNRKRKRIREDLRKELQAAQTAGDKDKEEEILDQMKSYGL